MLPSVGCMNPASSVSIDLVSVSLCIFIVGSTHRVVFEYSTEGALTLYGISRFFW